MYVKKAPAAGRAKSVCPRPFFFAPFWARGLRQNGKGAANFMKRQAKRETADRGAFLAGRYGAYFFLNGLGNGFLLCVSTLMLLARGLDLAQVSLVVAVQSVLSMTLELPSGMAGDLWGRKRVWLASRVFFAAQLALYLTARGPVLFLAAALGGTATALASGTVDAMYYDGWIAARGSGALNRANLLRTALNVGGTAAGTLAGGLMGGADFLRPYTLNLLAVAAAQALCLAAVLALPADAPGPEAAQALHSARGAAGQLKAALGQLAAQARATARAASGAPALIVSLAGAALLGFVLPGPQLYWQPRLQQLAEGADLGVLLGVLSCVSQLGAVAGSFLNAALARFVKSPVRAYALTRVLYLAALGGLALAGDAAGLACWFVAYYLTLGMHAAADDVVLQANVSGDVRGSVMGAQNLLSYAGITLAQLTAAALVQAGIPFLWGAQWAVLAAGSALCGAWYLGARWARRQADKGEETLQIV